MDQFLEVINIEENNYKLLQEKKETIEKINDDKERKICHLENSINSMKRESSRIDKKKEYLNNKKRYLSEFRKKSRLFGFKSIVWFSVILCAFLFLQFELSGTFLSIEISKLLLSYPTLYIIFYAIEYRYISKDFNLTIDDRSINLEEELYLKSKLSMNEKEITKLKEQIMENEELIDEISSVLLSIKSKIINYQKDREQYISKIIDNLDNYIPEQSFEKTNIEKVYKKEIH